MIPITRVAEPALLRSANVERERRKLQQYFDPAAPTSQKRVEFSLQSLGQVKDVLLRMCNGKCAYCESSLTYTSYGELEHFRPRAGARGLGGEYAPQHYWWLAYDWDNLLIACQLCNSKYKRDYFPVEDERRRAAAGVRGAGLLREGALLINPCEENPADHLDFLPDGAIRPLTKRGEVTIKILGLDRAELQERRRRVAADLSLLLRLLAESGQRAGGTEAARVVRQINALHAPDCPAEYVAVQRRVFREWHHRHPALWDQLSQTAAAPPLDQSVLREAPRGAVPEAEQVKIQQVSTQLAHLKRFSIKSVRIENFKSLEQISLALPPGSQRLAQESWLLLLGDNGIGKSSILQAIALALAGQKQLDRMQLDAAAYLRRGTSRGEVVIESYEHDAPVVLSFTAAGFTANIAEAPTFVLAYGSTRLLPKGGIQPDGNREPYVSIGNLFDYSLALHDPHAWLRRVAPAEFDGRVAPAFFDVLALRGEDRLQLADGQIQIQQFGQVQPLEDNSDGYKTIVGLVADLMQTLSADQSTYHNAQGIVLLDEIGNHLHPRWRLKIVGALRRAFPKLQFIVTTHEPLCLRGLAHGEVVVLVRDQAARIRTLDHTLLPDHSAMRIDQLLTSDLFGLLNVMDENVEATYEQYYRLLAKRPEERTAADRQDLERLAAEVAGKEVLGTTPAAQAYFQLIGEEYAKLKQEGLKTTEALKRETVSTVKAMLDRNNLPWL